MPENLHWSVDYAYHHSSNGDFRKQLWSCLEKSLCDGNIRCSLSEKKHHYTILPNFWNGYQPSLPDQGIGQATVHRNQESQSIWHYNIYCDNISNGAEMRLDFRAQTNVQPTVVDNGMSMSKVMQMGSTIDLTALAASPITAIKSRSH